MKKLKNFAVSVIALIVVVALSIGITLAILSTTSNEKSNVFTGVGGIKLTAEEPEWDDTGKNLAKSYYPGLEIPKDPALQNTSTDTNQVDEYAAMRLDYQIKYNDGGGERWYSVPKTDFDKVAKVQYKDTASTYADGFNVTDWDIAAAVVGGIEADTFFYYKKDGGVLEKDEKTTTLFDRVVINSTLTTDAVTNFTGISYSADALDGAETTFSITGFPQFRVVIKGVAVQSLEAGSYAAAKTSLDTLYPAKLTMLKVVE